MCVCVCSGLSDSETPWIVAHQSPLSPGFSRQEYWSKMPFPTPGDLPHLGTEPGSPALAGRFLTTELPGKQLEDNRIPMRKFSDAYSYSS